MIVYFTYSLNGNHNNGYIYCNDVSSPEAFVKAYGNDTRYQYRVRPNSCIQRLKRKVNLDPSKIWTMGNGIKLSDVIKQ